MFNIPEDSYDSRAYKSMPINSKVHIVDSYYLTFNPSTNPTTPTKHRNSKTWQPIWSRIFNNKQEPKVLKRYNYNYNHCHKANENWDAAISAAQCGFILKSGYITTNKSNPYTCNTSDLADGYIFKILDLNILTSYSH